MGSGYGAAVADLGALAEIPGMAWDGFDPAHLENSAAAVARLLSGAGLGDVHVVRRNRTVLPELLLSSPESLPGAAGRAYSSMRIMTSSLPVIRRCGRPAVLPLLSATVGST